MYLRSTNPSVASFVAFRPLPLCNSVYLPRSPDFRLIRLAFRKWRQGKRGVPPPTKGTKTSITRQFYVTNHVYFLEPQKNLHLNRCLIRCNL